MDPQAVRDTLALKGIQPAELGTVRWTRTSDQPSQDAFFDRCKPPAAAQIG